MTELFANNAASALSGGMTSVATTLTVLSATPFPATGNFRILVDYGANLEYMLVTGVAGAVFTVTRGIEGTTAVAHLPAVQVVQVVTNGGLAQTIADSAVPAPSTVYTTSQTLISPQSSITVLVDTTSAPITITISGTPKAGVKITVVDVKQTWTTNGLTFHAQASALVRNAANLGSTDALSVLYNEIAGGSITQQWIPGIGSGIGTWISI